MNGRTGGHRRSAPQRRRPPTKATTADGEHRRRRAPATVAVPTADGGHRPRGPPADALASAATTVAAAAEGTTDTGPEARRPPRSSAEAAADPVRARDRRAGRRADRKVSCLLSREPTAGPGHRQDTRQGAGRRTPRPQRRTMRPPGPGTAAPSGTFPAGHVLERPCPRAGSGPHRHPPPAPALLASRLAPRMRQLAPRDRSSPYRRPLPGTAQPAGGRGLGADGFTVGRNPDHGSAVLSRKAAPPGALSGGRGARSAFRGEMDRTNGVPPH